MDITSTQEKPIRVVSIGTSSLLVSRGSPMRVLKILRGLANHSDIDLRVFSTDDTNPVSGAKHVKVSGNFWNIAKEIIKSVKQEDADIIIGHTLGALRYLFLLRFFTKGKLLLEMHGFIAEEAYFLGKIGKLKYFINSQIHKLLFWWCDIVTTSSPAASRIVSKYNSNVHTIFNGANESLFNPEVIPEYNFRDSPDDIIIGYAGNSQTYQGLSFLEEAFDQLIKENNRFKLALLLSDKKENQNESPQITVIAGLPHNKVPAFLASCDILVVPRLDNEVTRISFASKLMEYMAMGKAVISSDIGDVNALITTLENGMLYKPDDTNGLIQALEYLVEEKKRSDMGKKARKTIIDKYTNVHLQDNFYSLIKMSK